MIELNDLLIFARVVEANSFSAAARKLKVPLATVSRRVAGLEKQLGVRLLDRTTRRIRLTSVGTELLVYAEQATSLGDTVVAVARKRSSAISGLLRIAAPPSITTTLIAPICCGFQAIHPEVRFQVFVTERLVDLIADGIDIAFHVGDLKDSTLIAKRVLTYRHRVLASPDYLKRAKPIRTPLDLLQHRLFAFGSLKPDTVWRLTHVDQGTQQSIRFQPALSMNDYLGVAYALSAHGGIGELPPIVEPQFVEEGTLVEVLPKWHLRTYNLSILHLGDRYTPPTVRAFKDYAAEQAAQSFPSLPT